jgi:hypothetical protein
MKYDNTSNSVLSELVLLVTIPPQVTNAKIFLTSYRAYRYGIKSSLWETMYHNSCYYFAVFAIDI